MTFRSYVRYATLSTSTLRAMYASLEVIGVLSNQRAAIAYELAMRAWAEEVTASLSDLDCVWTARGGRS